MKLAPVIDVDAGVMRVSVLGEPELGRCGGATRGSNGRPRRPPVAEDVRVTTLCDDDHDDDARARDVDAWFTAAVGAPCSLVRRAGRADRSAEEAAPPGEWKNRAPQPSGSPTARECW